MPAGTRVVPNAQALSTASSSTGDVSADVVTSIGLHPGIVQFQIRQTSRHDIIDNE